MVDPGEPSAVEHPASSADAVQLDPQPLIDAMRAVLGRYARLDAALDLCTGAWRRGDFYLALVPEPGPVVESVSLLCPELGGEILVDLSVDGTIQGIELYGKLRANDNPGENDPAPPLTPLERSLMEAPRSAGRTLSALP